MKQQYKRILFVAFFLFSFWVINFSTVNATEISYENKSVIIAKEEAKKEDAKEEEAQNGVSGCASYIGEDKEQCEEDRKATISTAGFMAKAMLSLDNAIAEQELDKDYIKNFENSSATALAYGISLIDPETILMSIINIVTSIFEKFGMLISLIVMILYNVASSSFIQTVIRTVFESLEAVLFDWSDPNSYIYKLLFLFGMVAILYRLFESRKQTFAISRFFNIVVMTVVSCAMIVFIGMYGKPFITNVETMMETSLTQTFSLEENKDTPLEIQTKEMLFENLQMKSFRLRHFGVTEASEIKAVDGVDNAERVKTLLNEPSVKNAKIERKVYKSTDISYNFGACVKVLGLSLVFIVHRLLLAIIFGAGALVLILLVLMKEILLGVSVFAVVFTLLKRNKSTWSWFLNRFQWAILCVLAKSFYAIFLYLISYLVDESIAAGGIILMIVIDIALLFAGKYAIKKAPEWLAGFLSDFNMEGQGAFQIAKGIFTGDFSPKDIYDNHKQRKLEDENSAENETEEAETNINNAVGMSDDSSLMDKAEDLYEDENTITGVDDPIEEIDENMDTQEKENLINNKTESETEEDHNESMNDAEVVEVVDNENLFEDNRKKEHYIQQMDNEIADVYDPNGKEEIYSDNSKQFNERNQSEIFDNKYTNETSETLEVSDIDSNISNSKRMSELSEEEKDDFFEELEWEDLEL